MNSDPYNHLDCGATGRIEQNIRDGCYGAFALTGTALDGTARAAKSS